MSPDSDPRVDEFIEGLPEWQQTVCRRVRELVHEVDPDIEETIKRGTQPYFVLEGNVIALQGTKNHVNVFLYDGAIVPDPEGIVTDGHDNSSARQIKIRESDELNEPAFREMVGRIVANNRAGGWRKIKRQMEGGQS